MRLSLAGCFPSRLPAGADSRGWKSICPQPRPGGRDGSEQLALPVGTSDPVMWRMLLRFVPQFQPPAMPLPKALPEEVLHGAGAADSSSVPSAPLVSQSRDFFLGKSMGE